MGETYDLIWRYFRPFWILSILNLYQEKYVSLIFFSEKKWLSAFNSKHLNIDESKKILHDLIFSAEKKILKLFKKLKIEWIQEAGWIIFLRNRSNSWISTIRLGRQFVRFCPIYLWLCHWVFSKRIYHWFQRFRWVTLSLFSSSCFFFFHILILEAVLYAGA